MTLFFAGGALGGLSYPRFGFANLIPFAAVLAVMALLPIAADVRRTNHG